MPNVEARLRRLQKLAENAKNGKITVYFEDGRTEYLTGGECVTLAMNNTDDVLKFEARGPGHGVLPDLLNGLLEN